MRIPSRKLDKEKLLGLRLLKDGKTRPDHLIGSHIIGAKVGNGGKGPPVN